MPDLLTPYDAARLAGVHPSTLRRWVAAGQLRAHRTPGGQHRYARGDLADTLGLDGLRGTAPGRDAAR